MPHTLRLLTMGIVALSVLLTSCGDDAPDSATKRARKSSNVEPHALVLTATGDAPINSLNYTFDGKTVQDTSAVLPWEVSVDVPADDKRHEWELIVQHGSGNVQLVATLDGNFLTQSQGGGTGDGTVRVSGWVKG
ncbi:MAG: hypothetical protein HOQ05_00315 [Corynebacteriales bacterium]|nr:hypothetical protein [Mycobacteriales bacterium]